MYINNVIINKYKHKYINDKKIYVKNISTKIYKNYRSLKSGFHRFFTNYIPKIYYTIM